MISRLPTTRIPFRIEIEPNQTSVAHRMRTREEVRRILHGIHTRTRAIPIATSTGPLASTTSVIHSRGYALAHDPAAGGSDRVERTGHDARRGGRVRLGWSVSGGSRVVVLARVSIGRLSAAGAGLIGCPRRVRTEFVAEVGGQRVQVRKRCGGSR